MLRLSLVLCLSLSACSLVPEESRHAADPVQPLRISDSGEISGLDALAESIGDSRILLLGENGHGVGSLTSTKVDLVRWLHREMGFEVLVFESGFFECGNVWRHIDTLEPRQALYDCLKYPFQHGEMLPLFEAIAAQAGTSTPLELAGMEIQAQGYDSAPRPAFSLETLAGTPDLATQVAALDSALYLVEDQGGLGDDRYRWAARNGETARQRYAEAAARTEGWDRWVFKMADGWIQRLAARGQAELDGAEERPPSYYTLRDEWMGHAVSALADSIAGPRKVIVWLHNDHARYGDPTSAGSVLRAQYGDDVYALGVFMGEGQIADNGRTVHDTKPYPAGGIEAFLKRDA